MPALVVWGQRLSYIAEDDLRRLARAILALRAAQLLCWTLAVIGMIHSQSQLLVFLSLVESENEEENLSNQCLRDRLRNRSIVWSFVACSAATIACSIVLEAFIFRISSRGSPVQREVRHRLPGLCAAKLGPLSAVRIAAVVLALLTLAILKDFCQPAVSDDNNNNNKSPWNDCIANSQLEEESDPFCLDYTVVIVATLAYTHVVEMASAALVVAWIVCRRSVWQQKTQQFSSSFPWLQFLVRPPQWGRRQRGDDATSTTSISHERGSCWHLFCQCCCVLSSFCTCCMFGGSEVIRSSSSLSGGGRRRRLRGADEQQQASILSDVSMILADYFDTGDLGTLDVTPTDLLVGLHMLGYEQRMQKKERLVSLQRELDKSLATSPRKKPKTILNSTNEVTDPDDLDLEMGPIVSLESVATGSFDCSVEHDDNDDCDDSGSTRQQDFSDHGGSVRNLQLRRTNPNSKTHFEVATRSMLKKYNESERLIIVEGAYYMRLALAVYGHMMYVLQHSCTAPCCLAAGFLFGKGSTCYRQRSSDDCDTTVIGDNHCGCNELGFLRMAGLSRDDVAYISFKTGIYQCPYGIVVDRAKMTIVIAIRGTFSLEGMVTDLNIKPEPLETYGIKYEALRSLENEHCHSGMLQCALQIFDDLERLAVLDILLLRESARYPGFQVVVTGHSLGAGIASILSLILIQKFEGLRCYCFAPPGCVMSELACEQPYITSFVLGSDIVPRMSFHSIVGLRNDVLEMIARIKVPKHLALTYESGKRKENVKDLFHRRESIPESTFYQNVRVFREHQKQLSRSCLVNDVKMFPPGKILHVVENLLGGSKRRLFGLNNNSTFIPIWAERSDFAEIQVTKAMMNDHDPERMLRVLTYLADSFQAE